MYNYVIHLLMDLHDALSMATEGITDNRDPKVVCHPVVALVMGRLWASVASQNFLYG